MPFQKDQFGHTAYDYKPAWEKDIDYSPDHRPADGRMFILDKPERIIWGLEVRDLGALSLGASLVNGQWEFKGLAIYSEEQILFEDAPADITGHLT